jgi:uroporphyrinogen-III decarboxylase
MPTNRERLLRTFDQQAVDRIPVSPFIHINYVKEFYGTHDVDWVIKTVDVYQHFGFDLVHRNCSAVYDAFGPASDIWGMETEQSVDGRDETTEISIRTPQGKLTVKEALRWVCEFDREASVIDYPIKSEEHLSLFQEYQPVLEKADVTDIKRAKEAVRDEGVVAPWIQGAFNLVAFYYRKLDDLLLDALLRPDFYHRMMNHFLDRYQGFVQQMIDAGADVLSYGGNVANGKLISSDFFKQHIWPYEKRLISFIQEQGVRVLYHNCGYARNLLPLYPDLDLRAYESLTPPPYGDTDLGFAVESFGNRTTLVGGIDQLDLLRKGSADEIKSAVQKVLDVVRGRCHFILGTTDYFNENTPHDNIKILSEEGRRQGEF